MHIETVQNLLIRACNQLGVGSANPQQHIKLTHLISSEVIASGNQPMRFFHNAKVHYRNMVAGADVNSGSLVELNRAVAALLHDVVYHNVDVKGGDKTGFSAGIEDVVGNYFVRTEKGLALKKYSEINFVGNETKAKLYKALLELFGHSDKIVSNEQIILNPFSGQNEILSALYCLERGLELGIKPENILVQLAHIQGTVPFGAEDHFSTLAKRYEKAAKILGLYPREQEIDEVIHSCVAMANQDVSAFLSIDEFFANNYLLMQESVVDSPDNLKKSTYLFQQCMVRTGFLEGLARDSEKNGSKRVFHSYIKVSHRLNKLKEWKKPLATIFMLLVNI